MSHGGKAGHENVHEVDVDHHVKIYLRVFGALLVLTAVTVGVAQLDLSTGAAIGLALFIATVKVALVACYFMHLIEEKKLILWVLGLTIVFFFFELLLPSLTTSNNIGLEQAAVAAPAEAEPAHH